MPCSAARQLLPDDLARALTPSERRLLNAHLATCPRCRAERTAEIVLHDRVRTTLHTRAAQFAPAPQAAQRLLARLPAGRVAQQRAAQSLRRTPKGAWIMNTRFVIGGLTALALSASSALAAPAVRTQVDAALKAGWDATAVQFELHGALPFFNVGVEANSDASVDAGAETEAAVESQVEAETEGTVETDVNLTTEIEASVDVETEANAVIEAGAAAASEVTADLSAAVDATAGAGANLDDTLKLSSDAKAESRLEVEVSGGGTLPLGLP